LYVAGTWSDILICDLQGTLLKSLSFDRAKDMAAEFDGFTVTSKGQVTLGFN